MNAAQTAVRPLFSFKACLLLALSLFVLGIAADHSNNTLAFDDFAFFANLFNGCANFHVFDLPIYFADPFAFHITEKRKENKINCFDFVSKDQLFRHEKTGHGGKVFLRFPKLRDPSSPELISGELELKICNDTGYVRAPNRKERVRLELDLREGCGCNFDAFCRTRGLEQVFSDRRPVSLLGTWRSAELR